MFCFEYVWDQSHACLSGSYGTGPIATGYLSTLGLHRTSMIAFKYGVPCCFERIVIFYSLGTTPNIVAWFVVPLLLAANLILVANHKGREEDLVQARRDRVHGDDDRGLHELIGCSIDEPA